MTFELSRFQRKYWAERAESERTARSVSIADPFQRDIELSFITTQLRPNDRLLEVGCGNGEMSRVLHQHVGELVAVDFSPAMVERAVRDSQAFPGLHFEHGNASHLRFPNESFDVVVCSRVLINMPTVEIQQAAIAEFHRVLRPGGRLVLLEVDVRGSTS